LACSDLLLSLSLLGSHPPYHHISVGSHPPSYIRWIPPTRRLYRLSSAAVPEAGTVRAPGNSLGGGTNATHTSTQTPRRLAWWRCRLGLAMTRGMGRERRQSRPRRRIKTAAKVHTILTILTMRYTLHDDSLHTTHYTLRTILTTPYTLYTIYYTRHHTHYSLHTTHYTLYTTHDTILTLHSTLYTMHYTPYSLHTTHCALRTTHDTLRTKGLWGTRGAAGNKERRGRGVDRSNEIDNGWQIQYFRLNEYRLAWFR
jgi:hypothetical protein